ncbi:hypothetical protein V7x_40920 [Crateriforma conspicua]|uniref:Uncharacterized protein n=1 Tax=Crateriforma conspicua TaxID=2527996 RepID=A0A5C6FPM3_9PLAN|nr:hypothetical protein [Crateriforma conspicua]TWU62363.1 hypothetical protein V7x_40920 [Crateriforma conspicua]
MSTPSETISFRLPGELVRKLDKQRDPFGDSRGDYSKRIVITHLQRDQHDEVGQQILELRQSVALLDDDLNDHSTSVMRAVRRLAFALLTSSEPLSVDKARELVRHITLTDAGEG